MRVLPELTPENTPFWTGGANNQLLIMHCNACDASIHPPSLLCPVCLSREVAPRIAKGTGTIYAFTVNHQKWMPDMTVPFVIAVVDLDGEPGVRVTAELVDADPAGVAIGQPVTVQFINEQDVWIPQFRLLSPDL